jgi:hypothetical protein
MLDGVRVHVSPEGDTVEVRVTVPVNAFTGATVIVDVPAALAFTVTAAGLALTVKSGTATLTEKVVEWESVPLVPVTVTVNVPLADAVHDSVDVPEPVTLVGERVQDSPVDGNTAAVRLTTPVKPLTEVTVIVDVAVPPTLIDADVGLAAMVKSVTVSVTVAVCVIDPLVPVIVIV